MTTAQLSTNPQTVALDVLTRLESAWNNADGDAFGNNYLPDASFVNVRGEHIVSSASIGAGHTGIFNSIYAGSVNRMELVRATEISDGVVLAVSFNTLDVPVGPLAGLHQAMSTNVIARPADGVGPWRIVSSHNTLLAA